MFSIPRRTTVIASCTSCHSLTLSKCITERSSALPPYTEQLSNFIQELFPATQTGGGDQSNYTLLFLLCENTTICSVDAILLKIESFVVCHSWTPVAQSGREMWNCGSWEAGKEERRGKGRERTPMWRVDEERHGVGQMGKENKWVMNGGQHIPELAGF